MFAIVNIRGCQYRLEPNKKIFVPKLNEEPGTKVTFNEVLMVGNDDNSMKLGGSDLTVEATVINHVKDNKVLVFKKKRRKNYKRTRGHRQQYTEIEINTIK
jgi:large subunit ribosomal protein L21